MAEHAAVRRTIFAQLITGALAVLTGVAALWFFASSSFLHAMDRANARRWLAGAIANQVLHLQVQQKDFVMHDMLDSAFYATGDTPTLQDHAASAALVRSWVDSLATLSEGADRADANLLQQDLGVYNASFSDLVTVARAHRLAGVRARGDTQNIDAMQKKTADALAGIDPVLAAVIVAAVRESDTARRRLVAAAPTIMLLGLLLAIGLVYFFTAGISRMTSELERAADDIGQGKFSSRVEFRATNELGRLALAFNHMAENLAVLVGAVHQSSAQLNASTLEIATTAREQEATASEIAVTTREVGATARAISVTSQELASTVKQVAAVAEQTATLAGAGQTDLTRLDTTMRQVTEASDSVSMRLAVLSEKAGNITSIVTTIVKVADQTNLLSLNAAIEAEKAGEYGRGFAVVAAEIRRLADQTAVATGDIERIIKEMQSAVTAGVMGMDKFSDEVRRGVDASLQVSHQLAEIISKVQALAPHFDMVNHGMQSQADGARQISEALAQLSASAQQTVESLAQSNRTIAQLNAASRGLQAGVDRFTVAT